MKSQTRDATTDGTPVLGWNNDIVLVPMRTARTGTGYAVFELVTLPRAGLPPLCHADQDVAFYVLEGSFTFQRADTAQMLGVDQGIFVRRGGVYACMNTGGSVGRLLVIMWPGAAAERFIRGLPVACSDRAG